MKRFQDWPNALRVLVFLIPILVIFWGSMVIFGDATFKFFEWNSASWQAVATALTGTALGIFALLTLRVQSQQSEMIKLETQIQFDPRLYGYQHSVRSHDWYYFWEIGLINYSRVPIIIREATVTAVIHDGDNDLPLNGVADYIRVKELLSGTLLGDLSQNFVIQPGAHLIVEIRVEHTTWEKTHESIVQHRLTHPLTGVLSLGYWNGIRHQQLVIRTEERLINPNLVN